MMQNPHYDDSLNKGPKGDKGDPGPAGTFTAFAADVSFGNHRIINLGNPIDGADAVNKNYADGIYVRAGEQINIGSNRITHLNDPADNNDALNRRYADGRYLRVGQNINLGSNSISTSSIPTADNDLVNKAYLESVCIKSKSVILNGVTRLSGSNGSFVNGIWLFYFLLYTINGIQKEKFNFILGEKKIKISVTEFDISLKPNFLTIINRLPPNIATINRLQIYYI